MEEVDVQVKDNPPSIERILRPIMYTSWFLGVGIAHPRKCPKAVKIIIRIIHIAVCSYIMIGDIKFSGPSSDINKRFKSLLRYIYYLNKMMCYVSRYYYIYYGIRQYNKWTELMDRLKGLDQKIRKEIPMNDRSIKVMEALAVFMTFIFCPLWPTIQILYYYIISYTINEKVIIDMLFNYILAQSLINSFVFDVVVYVLYRRFQTINKLIGQLEKLSDIQCIAFKIRRIRELHADVCDLASMVNDIHSLHLFFCSGNCFTRATSSLFYFVDPTKRANWLNWISEFLYIVYSMQFCLICWICTLACEESNKTGRIIHKIILNCQPRNLDNHEANSSSLGMQPSLEDLEGEQNCDCCSSRSPYVVENFLRRNLDLECVTNEVNNFSIQLLQNRIAFTAYDFFEINLVSYGWFVGLIITYVMLGYNEKISDTCVCK
ncbi:uncharacterized protein LOC120357939 [Solenopsis invicta]|uniref:uncharacterized protein LOC120357939 n=1 Tax=Solenopsis invicta TaxID=13686 RepID=UPI00193D748E|nr:uncharacterized protein LOC120357939 [Solenopsis invicta]